MKNTFSPFAKLIALAACALTLGSCSRADYAMLPKGGSYHGVSRVATPVPAKAETAAVVATPEAVVAQEVAVASAPAAVATTVAQPKAAAKTAKVAAPAVASTTAAAAPAPKTTLAQRIALNTVTRKIDKLVQKSGAMKKHENIAATSRLEGKLRQGLILLLVGLLVGIVGGAVGGSIGGIIGLLGLILSIVGIILIVLYLLDEV
ncbi:hypothetical protein [Hymenobacter sp. IS2118]|uniref:hypothetical protein n=1 Tax=Hymenobacter sp. IS2118 TaxID=1505605 RepID=UPI00054E0914|nr:hypothetical protein [Hymenobacter sp. IS2118]